MYTYTYTYTEQEYHIKAGLRASRQVWLLSKKTDDETNSLRCGRMRWLRAIAKEPALRARFWDQMRDEPLLAERSTSPSRALAVRAVGSPLELDQSAIGLLHGHFKRFLLCGLLESLYTHRLEESQRYAALLAEHALVFSADREHTGATRNPLALNV